MQTIVEGQHVVAEAIRRMVARVGGNIRQGPKLNQYSSFKDFLDMKPPIFKEAEELLQADEWLNTIEQKFRLLRLIDGLKAKYESHQLQGPARIWWSHHCRTMPKNVEVVWEQFRITFRGHYIPPGLMSMKHTEFMKLTQGNKSLNECMQAFNNLSRYATKFVDTDAKKIANFKRGLNPKLMKAMCNNKCTTFNQFINDALTQDNNNAIYATSKSSKRAFEAGVSQSKAPMASKPSYCPPAAKVRFCPLVRKNQTKTNFRKGVDGQ